MLARELLGSLGVKGNRPIMLATEPSCRESRTPMVPVWGVDPHAFTDVQCATLISALPWAESFPLVRLKRLLALNRSEAPLPCGLTHREVYSLLSREITPEDVSADL